MSLRTVTRDEILAALRSAEANPALEAAIEAVAAQEQEGYVVDGSRARHVRKALEKRYRFAHERGKTLRGDTELLNRLDQLGDKPVTAIAVDHRGWYIAVYFVADTLEPVGAVILEDPE